MNKLNKKELKQFINGEWIIFFDDESNKRFYYRRYYETIDRPCFSKQTFCVFNNMIDCNTVLDRIIKHVTKYGLPSCGIVDAAKIKLKAAKIQTTNK